MTITYGLTDQGLVVKSRLVIRDDLNTALQVVFGNSINVSDRSILGQLVGILSDRLGELWELLEQVASSQDPDKATKTLLDALALLTGTIRPGARQSSVTLTLTGVATTVVAAASEFATASTLKSFRTTGSVTLLAESSWVTLTVYALGARVTHGGRVYQCFQPGTSGATGPVGVTPDATLDGTCLWTFLGLGAASADADALSVEFGVIVATAKDITTIVTSIGGLQGVTNLFDASLGRLVAQDAELRTLRVAELATGGSSPFDALRAELLAVLDVTAVTLFANNTDITVDGVTPHAVEALVQGGDEQTILDTLFAGIAVGIGTVGNTPGTTIDTQGTVQAVSFSRPIPKTIYIRMSVSVDADVYPGDGDTQVRNALLDYGALQAVGRDVASAALSAQAFKVVGVFDVPQLMLFTDVIGTPVAWASTTAYVATPGSRSVVTNDGGRGYICIFAGTSAGSGGPTGTGVDIVDGSAHWYFLGNSLVMASREHADYISGNITVISTPGVP